MSWSYDPATATYSEDGEPLSDRQLADVRDAIADGFEVEAAALVLLWIAGKITLEQWALAFAGLLAAGVTAGFLLGYGGAAMMDRIAQEHIIELVVAQYAFLTNFANDVYASVIAGAPISQAMMAARSGLYAGATVEAYERAQAAAKGVSLPYWPADGQTECQSRCRCWWAYEQVDGATNAYWHTQEDPAVCPGCLEREAESDPFVATPQLDPGRTDERYRLAPLKNRRVPLLKTNGKWDIMHPQPEAVA